MGLGRGLDFIVANGGDGSVVEAWRGRLNNAWAKLKGWVRLCKVRLEEGFGLTTYKFLQSFRLTVI